MITDNFADVLRAKIRKDMNEYTDVPLQSATC